MAFNNVFKEPRRELTESAVGITVVGSILGVISAANYWIAVWLYNNKEANDSTPFIMYLVFGFLILLVGFVVVFGFFMISHRIGEDICTSLERRGIQIRPKERYNGRTGVR